jgi:hypothetical protein
MKLLNSVVVSAMVSETKIFTCYEFPEWMRLLWILWAFLPTITARLFTRLIIAVQTIEADFIAGLGWLVSPFIPVAYGVG